MNPQLSKLRQQTEAEQAASRLDTSQSQAREFSTAEELMRCDSEQNPVPPEVAERLKISIAAEPKPKKAWYKKIFGAPS